ncbi:hypothetical protein QG37_07825 [Candidozyma auris]|uniref:Uncharacterized protein n=1 Tax=Candidozyma auris TaxID=498019 RepID=A0A0L0NNZ5_CANAR|nr:hypothetical protein QG37_07825 [[Candida] auris]
MLAVYLVAAPRMYTAEKRLQNALKDEKAHKIHTSLLRT